MAEIMSALREINRVERIAAGEDPTEDMENQIDEPPQSDLGS